MLNTKCVTHQYKSFFVLHDDVLELAEAHAIKNDYPRAQAYPFTACIRVLEMWKDGRLKELDAAGLDEKDVTEEMLWLDIEWPGLSRFALRLYSTSSFKKVFPRVIAAGYVRQRYIKRDPKTGERVCDKDGTPLVYSTYQDAKADKKAHPGEIIHQALFNSDALNRAIAALGRPPTPDGGGGVPPNTEKGAKNEGAQRGQTGSHDASEQPSGTRDTTIARVGNTPLNNSMVSSENIPSRGQKNQGGREIISQNTQGMIHPDSQNTQGESTPAPDVSHKNTRGAGQNCGTPSQNNQPPLSKMTVVNSNSKNQEATSEEKLTSTGGAPAPAADILSHFDFFRDYDQAALTDLFRLIMPLPVYKSDSRKQTNELASAQACERLAQHPLLRERGLVHTARLLYYITDPASPCQWRKEIEDANKKLQGVSWVRPWHLSDDVMRIASREMEACNWWPAGLSPDTGTDLVEEITTIDLAELAGIEEGQQQGMSRDDALGLMAYVQTLLPPEDFPGVFLDYGSVARFQRQRGYYVSFWPIDGLEIKLYSDVDWRAVWANASLLGTDEFIPRLTACMASQVA